MQPGYEPCRSPGPERAFAEGRDTGLTFREHVRLQAVQDFLHHQTQSSYPAKLSQEPHFTQSFLQEPQEKVSHPTNAFFQIKRLVLIGQPLSML